MKPIAHLSSEELDLLELGSLDASEADVARGHLQTCSACTQRLEALRADAAHFRQYVQPRTQQEVMRARTAGLRWPAFAFAALAGALVVVFAVRLAGSGPWEAPYLAVRGDARFQVVVARGPSQAVLADGEVLRPGDRLRFRVDGGGAGFVLVVSRDPTGAWSVYAPHDGTESLRLTPGEQLLPGAVELDETLGREELVAIFSDAPLHREQVLGALSGRTTPVSAKDLPGARSVERVSFEKR